MRRPLFLFAFAIAAPVFGQSIVVPNRFATVTANESIGESGEPANREHRPTFSVPRARPSKLAANPVESTGWSSILPKTIL
jgi:hypothetical protein